VISTSGRTPVKRINSDGADDGGEPSAGSRSPIHRTASTTVFPVTTMRSAATPSRTSASRERGVGARCRLARRAISCRLPSSGNGAPRSYVRSPASTWATATPR
jgi:hypothetical protein